LNIKEECSFLLTHLNTAGVFVEFTYR